MLKNAFNSAALREGWGHGENGERPPVCTDKPSYGWFRSKGIYKIPSFISECVNCHLSRCWPCEHDELQMCIWVVCEMIHLKGKTKHVLRQYFSLNYRWPCHGHYRSLECHLTCYFFVNLKGISGNGFSTFLWLVVIPLWTQKIPLTSTFET